MRRALWARVAAETGLAVAGSGAVCFLAYALLGLSISFSGAGGKVMVLAPLVTPLLVGPLVALPFARARQRLADLLAEVEAARRALVEEVAERILVQGQLEELVRRDPLTGLLNRRGFFELAAARGDRDLAVMVVDVDDFKAVNDGWGHATGDAVLATVAEALRTSAGGAEVARLGGDEFALLADASEASTLRSAAAGVAAVQVERPDGSRATVGCSVGMAMLAAGGSVDAALAVADAKMYAAKRARPPFATPAGAPSELSGSASP